MKIITKTYEVYEYSELVKNAKDKAISDYINFILEVTPYEDFSNEMKRAVDKAKAMHTPWFTHSYIYEYALSEIEDSLRGCDFLQDGSFFQK